MTPGYKDDETLPTEGSDDSARDSERKRAEQREAELDGTLPLGEDDLADFEDDLRLDEEGADRITKATDAFGDMTEALPGGEAPSERGKTEFVASELEGLPDITEALPVPPDPGANPRETDVTPTPRPVPRRRVDQTEATERGRTQPTGRTDSTGKTFLVPESEFVSSGRGGSGETTLRRAPAEVVSNQDGIEQTLIAGRFEVLKTLGEGGMGKVYLVRDSQIEGRQVAMKLLRSRYSSNSQFRTLFFQEIRAAQNFVSENVVQVRDCGQMEDGKLFLTMDFVPGEDLSHLLKREKKITVRHALEITRQMLLGLHSGHEQGFIHRDIKPGNVILASQVPKTDENPMGVGVRLLDFGIAGLVEEMGEGMHAGTPSYMSPEQAKGQRLDPRSDLFAVGIVLFQMISGERPFTGKTKKEVTNSIIETNLSPIIRALDELPKPVRKLLEKALSKNRDKRYQSAIEFAEAIEDSSAYKLVGEVSPFVKLSLAAMTVVAGMAGGLLWKGQQELGSQEDRLEGLRTDAREHVKLMAAAELKYATLDGRYNTLKSEKATGTEIDDSNAAGLKRDLDKALAEALRLGKLADDHRVKENLWKVDEKSLTDRLNELDVLVTESRAEIAKLQNKTSPEGGTANDFDLILGHVAAGRGSLAAEALTFAKNQRGSFTSGAGAQFVSGIVGAANQLHKFERSQRDSNPIPIHVKNARDAFEDAVDAHEAFISQVQAANWRDWVSIPTDEPPNRVEAITAAFQRVSGELEAATVACKKLEDDNRDEVLSHPVDADPTRVIQFAKQYGPELAEEFLSRAIVHFREGLVVNGRLDKEALRNAIHLNTWAEYLKGGINVPTSGDAAEIKMLWLARCWYIDGESPSDKNQPDPKLPELSPGKHVVDWYAQFAIQVAFERSDVQFPVQPAQIQVYRSTSKSGSKSWLVDSHAGQEPGKSWEIQHVFYDDAGGTLSTLKDKIERFGDNFHRGQQRLMGTRELSDEVSVTSWDRLPKKSLPSEAYWTRQIPLESHIQALKKRAAPCLVVKRSFGELWISPSLGVVYEKTPAFTRELVYSGNSQ